MCSDSISPFHLLSLSLLYIINVKIYSHIIFLLCCCRRYRDQTKKIKDMEVQRKRLEADLLNRSLKVSTQMFARMLTSVINVTFSNVNINIDIVVKKYTSHLQTASRQYDATENYLFKCIIMMTRSTQHYKN